MAINHDSAISLCCGSAVIYQTFLIGGHPMFRRHSGAQISFLISFLTTAMYCVLVWYVGNAFAVLGNQGGHSATSIFTKLTTAPLDLPLFLNMLHWQLLAGISFVICVVSYLTGQEKTSRTRQPHPLLNHYGMLFLCILLNLTGFANAMFDVAYTIG